MSISSRKRQVAALLLACAALGAALFLVAGSATADPSISSKRAQAQAVLEQIRAMDSKLEKAIESYNYANIQLRELDTELQSNARHLVIAKQSLKVAQWHIAKRVRALYMSGGNGGAVEVLLGAQSLDDLLNRLDMVERVGEQDAKVLTDVKRFRAEVKARKLRLEKAREAQARVVARRAADKQAIQGQLAERERLLASIQDDIARLEAEERRRQAILAAQARARLEAQQRALAAQNIAAQQVATAQLSPDQQVETGAVSSDGSFVTTLGTSSARLNEEWTPNGDVPSPAPPPSQYGGVVGIAMQYLGTPYVWGGDGPGGFDCSGFTSFVYAQAGVSLPHHAASQYGYGTPVSQDQLEPGDLVFFDGLGHVGIYIGGGQFIHSPHTGDVVKISSLYEGWYASTWVGARRL